MIEPYVKHAQHFGGEGVMEVARDAGLTLKELEELLVEVDKAEVAYLKRTRRFVSVPKRKLTVEQRVKRLCGISDEPEESAK